MSRFHVMVVIADLGGGGAQRVVGRLVEEWLSRGFRVTVTTYTDAAEDVVRLPSGVARVSLGGLGRSSFPLGGAWANLQRVVALRRALRQYRPDTAVAFLAATNVVTVAASRGLPLRVVVSERNDPKLQSLGTGWSWARRWAYPRAEMVTANTEGALRALGAFVPPEKLWYVPNPVPAAVEGPSAPLDAPTVLAVGRLDFQKAPEILLQAFAQVADELPEWQLVWLGEGPLRPDLERQACRLNLEDRAHWVGFVSDPTPYYRASKIFVLPSRYEGSPNALLEAMSHGLPCVVTDASTGPIEAVGSNAGMVVAAENATALAVAIRHLARNETARDMLGAKARERLRAWAPERVRAAWDAALGLSEPDAMYPMDAD